MYELLETRYGLRPHRARESLEPVTAGVREAEALDVAEGAPLMQVERTAYARSGEPLEFARDLFRGDRTRIVIWTSEHLPDDRATLEPGHLRARGCGGLPNGRIRCSMEVWSLVRGLRPGSMTCWRSPRPGSSAGEDG